ncbi:MAG: D-alanyl-D-alanine carboxypeptidase family protein [Clostridia bacterium]|nr:D-alanyl-D-alanine carboxypeptidase family protein [Clostridia bacterium]
MTNRKKKNNDQYAFAQNFLRVVIIVLIILVLVAAFMIFKKNSSGSDNPVSVHGSNKDPDALFTDTATDDTLLPPITYEAKIREKTVDIQPNAQYNGFELPIDGATGYVGTTVSVYKNPDKSSSVVIAMGMGDCFTILADTDDGWLQIKSGSVIGWIESRLCFVNLPDVIPSIIYKNTNASSSIYTSSLYPIPGVTNENLYEVSNKAYNPRLGRDEYIIISLYSTAKKICAAQQIALDFGYTLVMHEAYRPYNVQVKIYNGLKALMNKNSKVRAGVSNETWSTTWFASTGRGSHQYGYAIDANLEHVESCTSVTVGKYTVTCPYETKSLEMPSPMHELSVMSITYAYPFSSIKATGWKSVPLADTMTVDALVFRDICIGAGFTPLASEWWHFNDLDARSATSSKAADGNFYPYVCLSTLPD